MTTHPDHQIPLWRDERFWKIALQILAVIIVVSVGWLLIYNLSVNMQRAGLRFGFDFLGNQASFSILDSVAPYDVNRTSYRSFFPYVSTDSYGRVLQAGLINTLVMMISGIILTTIVGIIVGVLQFSDNWLLRKGSELYIEIIRNTPLLLQLFFWYSAVFSQLPREEDRLNVLGILYASKRGLFMIWPTNTPLLWISLGLLVVGKIGFLMLWKWRTFVIVERGQSGRPQLYGLGILAVVLLLIFCFGLGWKVPQEIEPGTFQQGLRLSLEFSALLAGLVLYTAAFIAEIVRAGIQSVAMGQWEAARALGLRSNLTMRLVVFPQALRVIIPPLNSQYQNLAKNSSLGAAIAYAELYNVANTTYNQSGRPIDVMIIIAVAYLSINMLISFGMNTLNRLVQIKER